MKAALGSIGLKTSRLMLRPGIGMALVRREVAPGDAVEISWAGGSAQGEVREFPLD